MSNIVRRLSKSLPAPPPLLSRAKSKRPESVEFEFIPGIALGRK